VNTEEQWIVDLREYCRSLNISTEDLYKIVTDLKVAPMIRGKAFEFSTYRRLKQLLPPREWIVTKPQMNAQTGTHDVDILVKHNDTNKVISVECKLAGKGHFKVGKKAQAGIVQKGDYFIGVKCMRSRTTKSPAKVKAMAKLLGVSPKAFLAHSDQYRTSHFNVVATSIGNAFYETREDDDGNMMYKFEPTEEGMRFIKMLKPPSIDSEAALQEFVYNKVYIASSSDLAVSRGSKVVCGKRDCLQKYDCGFIPNYPVINFGNIEELSPDVIPVPKNRWIEIEKCQQFFEEILGRI
jgi:hypothetical protein